MQEKHTGAEVLVFKGLIVRLNALNGKPESDKCGLAPV